MKIAFSWDDGALEDYKLFELHEKYEIPGMFFVPTRNREGREVLTPQMMREVESKYIGFGGHTENHTYLTSIPFAEVEREILLNKEYLEDVLGHEIEDFCLPGGKYTHEIIDVIYKHFRTIRTADTMCFKYNGGVFKPTIHFYPRGIKSLLGNGIKNKSFSQVAYIATHSSFPYFELVEELIKREKNNPDSVIMIWGHSWELEKYDLWDNLDKVMRIAAETGASCSYRKMFEVK